MREFLKTLFPRLDISTSVVSFCRLSSNPNKSTPRYHFWLLFDWYAIAFEPCWNKSTQTSCDTTNSNFAKQWGHIILPSFTNPLTKCRVMSCCCRHHRAKNAISTYINLLVLSFRSSSMTESNMYCTPARW